MLGRLPLLRFMLLIVVATSLVFAGKAQASSEQVIYNFTGSSDGIVPSSGLILDASGNLFGVTEQGGDQKCRCGVVYELTPTSNGWTQTVLHRFTGPDGAFPIGNLAMDKSGNLYGTAQEGGRHNVGVVFELMPGTSGWQEKVLHSFTGGYDGSSPQSGVTLDGAGNVYCTARSGGRYFIGGVAFELMPTANGWKHNVLHSFGRQGTNPVGGLVFDQTGNLYGTTYYGGNRGSGLVFKLTHDLMHLWWNFMKHWHFPQGFPTARYAD